VTEKMEAGFAEAEQARQDEAEQRCANARQEREEAEFRARQAELRAQQATDAERERKAAEQRVRAAAREAADAALRPAAGAAKAAGEVTRLATAAPVADARRRSQARATALTNMFMWPWLGTMPNMQRSGTATAARGASGMEEVIPLGEEVLEVGKRTENRGTTRIHRFVVETPTEQQVTLMREKVVVERRRPVSDKVTGEILTEVTVEVVETEEVSTINKRMRLREEVLVRTERTQRVETVKATVHRGEVKIEQAGRKRGNRQLRAVTAEHQGAQGADQQGSGRPRSRPDPSLAAFPGETDRRFGIGVRRTGVSAVALPLRAMSESHGARSSPSSPWSSQRAEGS
jgi:uncharacterized protein (TIGR02271 family)